MDYTGGDHLNGRPGLRMAVWLHVKLYGRRLNIRPMGCTPALSVRKKRHCSCGMRLVALYTGGPKVSHYHESLLNRIKTRHSGLNFHQFRLQN